MRADDHRAAAERDLAELERRLRFRDRLRAGSAPADEYAATFGLWVFVMCWSMIRAITHETE
jgi:hypothetical protein